MDQGDRVLWLDKKTMKGGCMKLNRTWYGPLSRLSRVDVKWSTVSSQTKYCGTALSSLIHLV